MTFEGDLNRPNATTDEEDDLAGLADQHNNGEVLHQAEPDIADQDELEEDEDDRLFREQPGQQGQPIALADQLPDLTQTIDLINLSLNELQHDITSLALRQSATATARAAAASSSEDSELEEDLSVEYQDIDKNLDNIDEALSKLDAQNDQLQERLQELLQALRDRNPQDSCQ